MDDLPAHMGNVTLSQLYQIQYISQQRIGVSEWKQKMRALAAEIGVSDYEIIRLGSLARKLPSKKHLYRKGE